MMNREQHQKEQLTPVQVEFLRILRAFLHPDADCPYQLPESFSGLEKLFDLADSQMVSPLVFEIICRSAQMQRPEHAALTQALWKQTLQNVSLQAVKEKGFLEIYRLLETRGLHPLVVKGIVCRYLYQKPDMRASGDEDLLLPKREFPKCDALLRENGFLRQLPGNGGSSPLPENGDSLPLPDEITYIHPQNGVRIELHLKLFPESPAIFARLNREFRSAFRTRTAVMCGGTQVHTMEPTLHIFYLICHSFKHFLHSGFGIRQLCDMILFAERYGEQIDWEYLRERLTDLNLEVFTGAILNIGLTYLGFSPEKAHCPSEFLNHGRDCLGMLLDLLGGGVYGDSTSERQHSSNMTLTAAARGSRSRVASVVNSLFPSPEHMKTRYRWAEDHPALLPAAYPVRIVEYLRERRKVSPGRGKRSVSGENRYSSRAKPADSRSSLEIGTKRIDLLEQYGLLRKGKKGQNGQTEQTGQKGRNCQDGQRRQKAQKIQKRQMSGRKAQPETIMVDTREYLSVVRELVNEGKSVPVLVSGSSMTPFLIHARDTVVLAPIDRKLRKGDVVCFQRSDGRFVLHRIIYVKPEGYYLVGDHQTWIEGPVPRDRIFALVTRAKRKGQWLKAGDFWWEFFEKVWIRILPLREPLCRAYGILHRLICVLPAGQ